jgi:hypothetical protein
MDNQTHYYQPNSRTLNIVDWFDVNNTEHLKAYKFLMDKGYWEKGFIPDDMIFPVSWSILVAGKLAEAYINLKLSGIE